MSFFHPFRDRRRRALARQPFPPEWSAIIAQNAPFFKELHADEKARLEGMIKVFIHEKHFEGCGGLEITDEIRVTIAVQACLLLLNLRHDYYEALTTILVYPAGFNYNKMRWNDYGAVTEEEMPVSGLSCSRGVVVLSWPDAIAGSRNTHDGHNVVFHEFAHQLDQLSGAVNGAPLLDSRSHSREWCHTLSREYSRLQEHVARNIPSVIRAYGATEPAEFFAVVTEIFFEQPLRLKTDHPELYEEFKAYYRQDPAERMQNSHRNGNAPLVAVTPI